MRTRRRLGWLVTLALLGGCELIVGFNPPPESGAQCSDGLDNDQNGLIDCRDPGCAGAPGCTVAPDAGTPDAPLTPDAGTPDAGSVDAGTPDAGTPDAGSVDAGTPDSGVKPFVCGNGVVDPPRPALRTPVAIDVAGATRVVAADFNDDGIMDLAVLTTGATSSSVTVLFGDGITFTQSGPPSVLETVAKAIAVGDATGDGLPDIAVVGDGLLTILANGGDGSFPMLLGTSIGGDQTGIAFADFDSDGTPDLAVTNTTDVVILRQIEASGNYPVASNVSVGTAGAVRVASADLDGDGGTDLVVSQAPGQIAVLRGSGFALGTPTFTTVGAGADALALGDLDGDGRPDIVVASTRAHEVAVILGDKVTSIDVGDVPEDVAILDLDGDGDRDVVVSLAGGTLAFLINDGGGTLTLSSSRVTLGGAGTGLVPLHVDADTLTDLAVAEPGADRVEILGGAGQTEECDGSAGCSASCTLAGGTPIWGVALGGPGADVATDVTTDTAGNVYVAGTWSGTATLGGGAPVTSAGMDDIFVASFTAGGAFRWRAVFGGPVEDTVDAIAYDPIANELVIGGMAGPTSFGGSSIPIAQHAFVARLDPATGAATSVVDPLGQGALGEVLTVAVDARGRLYAGGSFSGTVSQGGGEFSGDGGFWTVFEGGQQGFIQSFTSNDTNRVARIVADARGPILLVAYAGTIRELDDVSALPAIFVSRYSPAGFVVWRQDFRSDADPGILPADLVVDPLGRALAYATFSGNLTLGESTITAQGASDGILALVTSDARSVKLFDVGDSANGLGADARGDFFLAGSLGLVSRQFDAASARWSVPPDGMRARRFAFGPRGEMYIAGRLIAPVAIGSSTLRPSGASDALVARVHP